MNYCAVVKLLFGGYSLALAIKTLELNTSVHFILSSKMYFM